MSLEDEARENLAQMQKNMEEMRQVHLSEIAELNERHEARQRENDVLRGLVATLKIPCVYCGKENMAECPTGFPGCPQADDLIVGEDTTFKALIEERNGLREKIRHYEENINSAIEHSGCAVRVCEGGGPEDLMASMAVTFAKLHEKQKKPFILLWKGKHYHVYIHGEVLDCFYLVFLYIKEEGYYCHLVTQEYENELVNALSRIKEIRGSNLLKNDELDQLQYSINRVRGLEEEIQDHKNQKKLYLEALGGNKKSARRLIQCRMRYEYETVMEIPVQNAADEIQKQKKD